MGLLELFERERFDQLLVEKHYLHSAGPIICSASKDRVPYPIQVALPNYPAHLRDQNLSDSVTVLLKLDQRGSMPDAKVEETFHPDFNHPALDAIFAWRFVPAYRQGEPSPIWVRVPIRF